MNDTISREAAYDTLTEYYHHTTETQHKSLKEALNRVPPISPDAALLLAYERGKWDAKQKHGKWIHGRETAREMIGDCITAIFYEDWKCSECGFIVKDGKPLWNYCPSCGAKMERSEE